MAINYIARQDIQWQVVSTKPDVCKTPMGPAIPPVPYPVTANMAEAVNVVPNVRANGGTLLVLNQSFMPQTKGDEAGIAKGVSSGTVGDICEPLAHSQTVRVGGEPVLRHNDMFWMNARNTTGIIVGQPPAAIVSAHNADLGIQTETTEEKEFFQSLLTSYVESQRQDVLAMADMANAIQNATTDFFTDHTPDDVMNSQAIGAMLSAGSYYNMSAETARNIAEQIGGEALENFNTIDTPQNRALMQAVQGMMMAYSLRSAGGIDMDGARVKGKTKGQAGEGENFSLSFCTKAGEPVDVVTGDFLQELSVLALPGTLPLSLSRIYRSQAKSGGLFGPKWSDEWSASLTVHGGDLHFTDHEGVVLYYPIPQDGIFLEAVNSRQAHYRLAGDIREQLFVFDRRSQQTQVFSPSGNETYLLSAIYDRSCNRIDFIRTDELLTQIRHSDGYTLTLDWQHRQLMSIDLVTPQRQRLVTCHYDNNGFLAECDTFQFTHLWHEYPPEGFMTRWRDTDKTQVSYRYDEAGRVTALSTPEGYYNDRFIYNDEEHCTTYLDAEGGQKLYRYNENNLVTRITDALGREEITAWEGMELQSRTDALGRTTEYHYNEEGDIRHVALPGGHSLRYEYNAAGQLTRLTAPGDQTWLWAYDDHGSLLSLTDPQGRSQQFSYSAQGDLLAHILPGGATWRWRHDSLHQVRETIAPNGGVTHTEQDMLGRLLSAKDPLGFTTQFRHSKNHAGPQGSIEEINRPDGVRELMRQNSEKLTESFTDGEGKTSRYEYGAFDLLTAVIRPDGERLECRYDKLTRLTEIINAAGGHYRLTYDKAGQLVAETDFTGRTLTYSYDAAGRCICTSFPDGTRLNRVYNVTDQVVREDVTQGDSIRTLSTTLFRHDTLCRLVEAKNEDATVTYEYDEAGRLCAETLNGRRTGYQFGAQRDHIAQRTTAGITEHFTRGLMGELTRWQLADHTPLTFSHDLRGQEIIRQNDTGFRQQLAYTPAGRLTEQQVGNPTELNPHDRRNKTLHRQWLYDKAYNLTMIADSLRGTAVHTLTANDQISHATWTGSSSVPMREERFTYDQNLNITRRQTWVNEVLESEAYQQQQQGRVASRGHKAWRHTTSRINPDSGKPEDGKFVRVVNEHNITWKYDVNGRLVEKLVDKGGYRPLQWRYRWDARSQLTGLETPDGERWEYRYDPFGRRISKRCTSREKTGYDFHWNGDQLTEEIPVYADGTPAYDESIRWIYEPGSVTPLARYEKGQLHYAVTDTVGRIQELLTEDGTIAWRGRQHLWGREESANDDNLSCRLRFPGQYEDAESGLHYNRFRYYDTETGQYISADPIGLAGGVNPYGYVHNPLSWVDPLGLSNLPVTYWPPNDGAHGPITKTTLEPGTTIDRYGLPRGKYTSPYGTPYSMRALPPGTDSGPYSVYKVVKPIPNVAESKIAPWFGESGMGTQYKFEDSVQSYLDSGHLEKAGGKCC
ncbi:MAG TPA: PAAR-like domain-containing protein [Buttiauxella sp.]|nr:PAAR-like domain-containing protein [Buttiauxella sp.]